jgi:hypothetical protein
MHMMTSRPLKHERGGIIVFVLLLLCLGRVVGISLRHERHELLQIRVLAAQTSVLLR